MKRPLILLLTLLASVSFCLAQGSHYVEGYYRQNGTFVPGHYATNPNGNPYDNWSTKGNYNPYTGQPGTVNPSAGYFDAYGVWHPYSR